mgnify:CR=1 FL=1
MNQETVTQIISFLALLSHIGLVIVLISYFVLKEKSNWFWKFLGNNGILFAFLVALSATLGSLYYSEIAKLEPCVMCWYARIAMYPIVIIAGLALFKKKDKSIIPYGILLAVAGMLVNLYHVYLQFGTHIATTCSPFAYSVSCSDTYFVEYGYISFPVLSLTAFVMIIVALLFTRKHS